MEKSPNKSFNGSFNGSFEDFDYSNSPPILPEMMVPTNEENEEEIFKIRAKLFRYDSTCSPPEWKERGTGDVKLLRNRDNDRVRVVMRRDKTLRICANHFIIPWMELHPCNSSDRAWVYSAPVDFADEKPVPELLAIKFANTENAKAWKTAFDNAKEMVASALKNSSENKEKENTEVISTETEKLTRAPSSSSLSESSDSNEINDLKEESEEINKVEVIPQKEDTVTADLVKDLENILELKTDSTPSSVKTSSS